MEKHSIFLLIFNEINPIKYWKDFEEFKKTNSDHDWFLKLIKDNLWNGTLGYDNSEKIIKTNLVEKNFPEEFYLAQKAITDHVSGW